MQMKKLLLLNAERTKMIYVADSKAWHKGFVDY